MTDAQKVEINRKADEYLKLGRALDAGRLFKSTQNQPGLIRVGDYLYFEKSQPLLAYGYYRAADHKPMLNRVYEGFIFALKCLLDSDEGTQPKSTPAKSVDESYKIRTANPVDQTSVGSKPVSNEHTKSIKIARAVALLKGHKI